MSLTTRCPACATTFRVVPDQLKLSDGWVRCGHCADVFDATRYLETWTPPEPEQSGLPAAAAGQMPAPAPPGLGATSASEPVVQDAWPEPGPSIDLTLPSALPPAHARTDEPAGAGLGDMPIVNRPEVPSEAAPDLLSKGLPEGAPPSEAAPSDPAFLAEAFARTSASDTPAGFEPTDLAPLQGADSPAPPSPDDRDELDRLLDRVLDEEARSEQTEDAAGTVRPDVGTASAPASSSRPVPAPAPAADEADFQAELQRYANRLRQPTAPPAEAADAAASDNALVPALVQPAPANHEADQDADDDGDAAASDEPEFVRQAKRRAFWHSPGVRAVLVVLVLLLSALLAGQWAVHERDRLAASQPQLLPWLDRLCEPLGCRVSPVRDIDAIVIDSSTLVRRLGNFYSFDLVLKNTSPLALAVPALELSLTDTGDRVISRRVFLPEELPGVPPLLPAQASVPVSLRLSLAVGDELPMAGYRALVFYP